MEAEAVLRGGDQYLTFFVSGQECGIPILQAREIIELELLTRVPGSARAVRGVINLRGTVVPVLDLAVRFGGVETAITTRTCVVVVDAAVDGGTAPVGLMADAVSQ